MDDPSVAQAILDHIGAGTTHTGSEPWREPVANYLDPGRLAAEVAALRALPVVLCPSAALTEPGSYLARDSLGTPLVAVRQADGSVRVFRNVCRHRGMAVADGTGCARSLACPYHGWTYGLDGELRHVPHEDGFPAIDHGSRGLAEVPAAERHGLVFVTQDGSTPLPADIDAIDGLLGPELSFTGHVERDETANWKILAETFLEGLHIKFLHRRTFFPVQYDNLNLVEHFGAHSRITFPFRNIERLADVAPDERTVEGRLTFVYQLFPNAVVATFPGLRLLFVLDPISPGETHIATFAFTLDGGGPRPKQPDDGERPLLADGGDEDFVAARAVQHGLASGANQFLEFGLHESAIGHFHRQLDAVLGG